jgi:hypothetical protein
MPFPSSDRAVGEVYSFVTRLGNPQPEIAGDAKQG